MRPSNMLSVLAALSLCACSQSHQEKTQADAQAAAHKVSAAAQDVASSPELKAVGSDIKVGAQQAGETAKVAAAEAGAAARDMASDVKHDAKEAQAKIDARTEAERK